MVKCNTINQNIECKHCKNTFVSQTSLKHHQKTAKYCLKLQGRKDKLYICEHCGKDISTKHRLYTHYQTCDKYKSITISIKHKEELSHLHEIIAHKDELLSKHEQTIKDLQNKLENVAIKAVSKSTTTTNNKEVSYGHSSDT